LNYKFGTLPAGNIPFLFWNFTRRLGALSRLEKFLWACDFVIAGIAYLIGGLYAGLACFFVAAVLTFTALLTRDEKTLVKHSGLVDVDRHPYVVRRRLKLWHKWGIAISVLASFLGFYGWKRHSTPARPLPPTITQNHFPGGAIC
jgi:hypothetical protein